jgi:hypothetical protein
MKIKRPAKSADYLNSGVPVVIPVFKVDCPAQDKSRDTRMHSGIKVSHMDAQNNLGRTDVAWNMNGSIILPATRLGTTLVPIC